MFRSHLFRFAFVAFFLVTALTPAAGNALEFGARGYYWFPTLKGDLQVDTDSVKGTKVDFKDTLGIDNKNIPSVEAFAGIGHHHLSLMYTHMNYTGSATLTNVVFNGTTYNGLTDSDFRLRMLDAEYQYDLINLENILAGFSIGVLGKLKYINGEANLKGAPGESKNTFDVAVPMIGAGAHVGILLNILEARAKVAGIGYSGSYCYEGLAEVSYTPFPFLDLAGGYRYMKLKIDDISHVTADSEIAGPYLSLTVSF